MDDNGATPFQPGKLKKLNKTRFNFLCLFLIFVFLCIMLKLIYFIKINIINFILKNIFIIIILLKYKIK